MRALSVIIQDTTSELTDTERVMFLLLCANAEYHQSDEIDADLIDLHIAAQQQPAEHYNYNKDD